MAIRYNGGDYPRSWIAPTWTRDPATGLWSNVPVITVPTTTSQCGPYDSAVCGAQNIQSNKWLLMCGHRYRIRQTGTITAIKFGTASNEAGATAYINFQVWRKNIAGTYDKVGESGEISFSNDNTIHTVNLASPITGVQEGDYYAIQLGTISGGAKVYFKTGLGAIVTTYYTSVNPNSSGYDWESASAVAGAVMPIEIFMTSPVAIFIGNSLMSGCTANYSFIEDTETTDIESTVEYQFNILTMYSYQNMGHSGNTSTTVASRFVADVVALTPLVAVILVGVNDVFGGVINQATFISNYTSMLDACVTANIKPIVIPILPWTNGTDEQMGIRDTWNAALEALVATYPTASFVDCSSYVGKFRATGPVGNLWDIQDAYDSDGVHLNADGYGAIALALREFEYIDNAIRSLFAVRNYGRSTIASWGAPVIIPTGYQAGVIGWATPDFLNYIRARHDGTYIILEKVVSGTPTVLVNEIAAYSDSLLPTIVREDATHYHVEYDGAQVGATIEITDAEIINNTWFGIYNTGDGTVGDPVWS